jgi:hypothetical protein
MNRHLIAVCAACVICAAAKAQPFTCTGLSLSISGDGRVASLTDTVTGVNRVTPIATYQPYFCMVKHGGTLHMPTAFSRFGNQLTFTFGTITPAPVVTSTITSNSNHLLITLSGVSNVGLVEEVRFASCSTQDSQDGFLYRFVRYSDSGVDRVIGILPLDVFTSSSTVGGSGSGGLWYAAAAPGLQYHNPPTLVGRRAALFASAGAESAVRAIVGAIETQYGVALGLAAQADPELNRSCFFWQTFTQAQRSQIVQWTADSGSRRMLLQANHWADTANRLQVNPDWGSAAGLQSFANQCRAAGIDFGLHFFPLYCDWRSPVYVGMGADPRLRRDRTITLAAPLTSGQSIGLIQTTTPPTGWPTTPNYRDIVIDGEIIEYSGLSLTPPYGFSGPFVRGKRQSAAGQPGPQNHSAGATIGHLVPSEDVFGYHWDFGSGGIQQHAMDASVVVNQVAPDFIYFDGMEPLEPAWYSENVLRQALFEQLATMPSYAEGSGASGSMAWPYTQMNGAIDFRWNAHQSFKAEVDRCITRLRNDHLLRMSKWQIGWAILSNSSTRQAQPDDIEYICAKSIAWGAAIVWHAHGDYFPNWPLRDQNLYTMRTFESLRIGNYFDAATRERIKRTGKDFFLMPLPGNNWTLAPMTRLPVAEFSSEVRAFLSDEPVNGARVVSAWATVSAPRWLLLDVANPGDVFVTDHLGNPVAITVTVNGALKIPLVGRINIHLPGVANPTDVFGRAGLTNN